MIFLGISKSGVAVALWRLTLYGAPQVKLSVVAARESLRLPAPCLHMRVLRRGCSNPDPEQHCLHPENTVSSPRPPPRFPLPLRLLFMTDCTLLARLIRSMALHTFKNTSPMSLNFRIPAGKLRGVKYTVIMWWPRGWGPGAVTP